MMSKFGFELKMSFAVWLAAMGMLGLALLSATQWARVNVAVTNSFFQFFLGVAPNVAAGYAMPLILASFVPKVVNKPGQDESRRVFLLVLAFTTLGLVVWEFIQTNSRNLYFDVNDIVATLVGAFLAFLSYLWLCRAYVPDQENPHSQTATRD